MASWKADVSGSLDSLQSCIRLQSLKKEGAEPNSKNTQQCQIFTDLDKSKERSGMGVGGEKEESWLLVLIFSGLRQDFFLKEEIAGKRGDGTLE